MTGIARHQASDSDELADALTGWSQEYTQLGRGRLQAELLLLTLPEASLIYEHSNLHLHQSMAPPQDQVVIALPLSVAATPRLNGQPLSRDSLVLLAGGTDVEICAPGEFQTIGLSLSQGLLSKELASQDQELFEQALKHRLLSLPQHAAQYLRENLCSSLNAFERGERSPCDPHHAKRATVAGLNYVLEVIREALCRPGVHASSMPRGLAQRRRLVLAAIEYMRADLSKSLSLPELSQNLHTSLRTLHYCFREICQTSPHQFLLCLRLAEARRRLKRQQSITDLALELGFYSSSHFSSLYKRLYSERPSMFGHH